MSVRLQRRFAGWLVIAAVALHLLGPSMSQALASWSGTPDFWQQICSAHGGSEFAPEGSAGSPQQQDEAPGPLEHCPYCLLHFAHWAPTSQSASLSFEAGAAVSPPAWPALAPEVHSAWASPPSRAPPSLS
ncbi:MAG TPA: DUF2946 domain-containing protein [Variovorax sp.]|jgi:hypothetical protein